jgi:large subunit ribosomal protein L15
MLQLNTIKAQPGATHPKKRLGRGSGSGLGKTAGKGHKGQLARSGGHVRRGFEGGQMPLYRRIPKRGFTNFMRRIRVELNLADLEERLPEGVSEVSLETLREAGLISGKVETLSILGTGEIKRPLTVYAHKFSEVAKKKIEAAGGRVEMIKVPTAVVGKNKKLIKKSARK